MILFYNEKQEPVGFNIPVETPLDYPAGLGEGIFIRCIDNERGIKPCFGKDNINTSQSLIRSDCGCGYIALFLDPGR